MVKQMDTKQIEDSILDTVIIGSGMAGLTAGYMLRDRNILVLEEEERFGGRVLTEMDYGIINNIGTQFYTEDGTTFVSLLRELGVEKIRGVSEDSSMDFVLNNKMYHGTDSLVSFRFLLDALRFFPKVYRKGKVFQLPPEDPRYQKLIKRNVGEFMHGLGQPLRGLVDSYVATSTDNTSAGLGMYLLGDMMKSGDMHYVKGGFQKVTEAMVDKLDGKVMQGAEVIKVEDKDGIVSTHFMKNGKEHIVKSRSVVMSAPANIALKLIPDLPSWKKEVLSKVQYGPLTTVSLFLKKDIPWKRFSGLITDNALITTISDHTHGTEEDKDEDKPIIYSVNIDDVPENEKEIDAFFSKSDEEVVRLVIDEINRNIIPDADIEKYLIGSKVNWFRVGEVDTKPQLFMDLPLLSKPVGNIHFCGDYTHRMVFIEASAYSGMRAARELGSKYVLPEEEMLEFPIEKKWGAPGWATMICNTLLIAAGFFLPGIYGPALSIGAGLLLSLTALWPAIFPPIKLIYKVLLGLSVGFGGIIGLLAKFLG